MTLTLESKSKNEKTLLFEKDGKNTLVPVNNDPVVALKKYLNINKIKLSDFTDFLALESESFTGTRESFLIANTLKHYVLKVSEKDLKYPNYHKEPNIGKPKIGFN